MGDVAKGIKSFKKGMSSDDVDRKAHQKVHNDQKKVQAKIQIPKKNN